MIRTIYSLIVALILNGNMISLDEMDVVKVKDIPVLKGVSMEENLSTYNNLKVETISKDNFSNDKFIFDTKIVEENDVEEIFNESLVVLDEESIDESLLFLINDLRISNGLQPLSVESWLEDIAGVRAMEASEKWSHTRPDGSDSLDMIPANKWAGENLSFMTYDEFYFTSEQVDDASNFMFEMLCNSPTHLDNMLFEEFETIGIETYLFTTETGKTRLFTAYIFSN